MIWVWPGGTTGSWEWMGKTVGVAGLAIPWWGWEGWGCDGTEVKK